MPCLYPRQAYRSAELNSNGKRPLVWREEDSLNSVPLKVRCGSCNDCRLNHARTWAVRCMLHASMFERSCFITLTYDDDHLPVGNSLDKRVFQKFMKRLRKKFGNGISYFHCGEYGGERGRPHYHALLFGIDFPDMYLWKHTGKSDIFRSDSLEKLWTFGFSSIGELTFDSAAYVARYTLKKSRGAEAWIDYVDSSTGLVRSPEYITMSNGIAKSWFEKYCSDVYPHDFLYIKGRKFRPPKYFDKLFSAADPFTFDDILFARQSKIAEIDRAFVDALRYCFSLSSLAMASTQPLMSDLST